MKTETEKLQHRIDQLERQADVHANLIGAQRAALVTIRRALGLQVGDCERIVDAIQSLQDERDGLGRMLADKAVLLMRAEEERDRLAASIAKREAKAKADALDWLLALELDEDQEGTFWRSKVVLPEIERLRAIAEGGDQ